MDFEAEVSEIKEFIKTSFETRKPISVNDYIDNYTRIYLLSKTEEDSAKLYACYDDILSSHLTKNIKPILTQHHGTSLLINLTNHWDLYKRIVTIPLGIFSYLDRSYTSRNSLPALIDVATMCFKRHVFEAIQSEVTETILAIIESQRNDEACFERAHLGPLMSVLMEMDCYEGDFEVAMLEATAEFYSRKAGIWIQEMRSCSEYLIKAEIEQRRESDLALDFLLQSSVDKVVEKVRYELLRVPANRLFEDEKSGFRAMVRGDEEKSVRMIFQAYCELPEELQRVAELFGEHVRKEVKGLVESAENGTTDVIEKLVGLHDRYYRRYLNVLFEKHQFFDNALTEAFENEFGTKSSSFKLIANYCDEILKKGEHEDIDSILESIVMLLVYVKDRDMFVELYCKKLSRRLLNGHSVNIGHENTILAYMKQRLGNEFIGRMEIMISDVTKTEANVENFENFVSQNPLLIGYNSIDLAVTEIAFDKWPNYEPSNIKIPEEMEKSVEAYSIFFKDRNRHKKLSWLHTLGTCVIQAEFEAKSIELTMSTYQAIVLSLFNSEDTLSYFEIKTRLKVKEDEQAEEELLRTLQSLSCAEYKILLKKPENKNVSKDDVFEFNAKFNDPSPQIKVPFPIAALEEKKIPQSELDKDRRYVVDCMMVKIMKHHKVLSYQSLMTECVEMLSQKFKPCLNLLKGRTESLIDRDFIERDENDPTILHYVS